MSSPPFLFRFCIWKGSKNISDVCHILREVLFMLDVTQCQVDVETSVTGYLCSIFKLLEAAKDGLLLLSDI